MEKSGLSASVWSLSGVLEYQDWEVKSKNIIRRSPPFLTLGEQVAS